MIVLIATLRAKNGKEPELEEALKAMMPEVQMEPGAVAYTLHRAVGDPAKFFFYEMYLNQEALDFHNSTPYLKELFSKFDALLEGTPQVEFFNDIASINR